MKPKTVAIQNPAMAERPKFLSAQSGDQLAFSKFGGTDVVGPDHKKIGDVNDVLFDKKHRIITYVVGVGGSWVSGKRNVAIEPTAFELWRDPEAKRNDPNKIKLKVGWTKKQLESAPAFEYYDASKRATSDSTPASGRTTTTGTSSPTRER